TRRSRERTRASRRSRSRACSIVVILEERLCDVSQISVLILMGSDSDAPVMQGAVDVLRELAIPCEMTVASAHRSPERVMRLVKEAPGRGVKGFVVGAGAAAHLAGVVAAQ